MATNQIDMKRVIQVLSLLTVLGCKAPTEVSFFVAGSCAECAGLIENALTEVSGVEFVSWSEESSMATVLFDGTEEKLELLQQAISAAGFDTQFFQGDGEKKSKLPECCRHSNPSLHVSEEEDLSPH